MEIAFHSTYKQNSCLQSRTLIIQHEVRLPWQVLMWWWAHHAWMCFTHRAQTCLRRACPVLMLRAWVMLWEEEDAQQSAFNNHWAAGCSARACPEEGCSCLLICNRITIQLYKYIIIFNIECTNRNTKSNFKTNIG